MGLDVSVHDALGVAEVQALQAWQVSGRSEVIHDRMCTHHHEAVCTFSSSYR